ncbi:MAG TPA: hypothetical protein VL137_08995 [Polyangiaceae bacterium]|jgi:hypothetical protein|nr:hypothetical protein [Polyangiaceae bacterium]
MILRDSGDCVQFNDSLERRAGVRLLASSVQIFLAFPLVRKRSFFVSGGDSKRGAG